MRNAMIRLILIAACFLPVAAFAQAGAMVVATCGTLGQNYTAGATRPLTVDTAGTLCTSSGGGGGGGGGTSSTFGAASPTSGTAVGARSGANMVELIQASASVAINMATATTTQLVALSGSTKIYVTSFDVMSAGTGNATFVYGTGSNCATGLTALTGAYNLTAQAGIAKGSGLGPVLVVPAGNALCMTSSAAVQMSGSVSYTQF